MTWISGAVVVVFSLWLLGLAAGVLLAPARVERFLRLFASSARAHYTEQLLRLFALPLLGIGAFALGVFVVYGVF